MLITSLHHFHPFTFNIFSLHSTYKVITSSSQPPHRFITGPTTSHSTSHHRRIHYIITIYLLIVFSAHNDYRLITTSLHARTAPPHTHNTTTTTTTKHAHARARTTAFRWIANEFIICKLHPLLLHNYNKCRVTSTCI